MKEENSMYKPKNEELIGALEKACVFIVGEKTYVQQDLHGNIATTR
jgi:hypothetical protein